MKLTAQQKTILKRAFDTPNVVYSDGTFTWTDGKNANKRVLDKLLKLELLSPNNDGLLPGFNQTLIAKVVADA